MFSCGSSNAPPTLRLTRPFAPVFCIAFPFALQCIFLCLCIDVSFNFPFPLACRRLFAFGLVDSVVVFSLLRLSAVNALSARRVCQVWREPRRVIQSHFDVLLYPHVDISWQPFRSHSPSPAMSGVGFVISFHVVDFILIYHAMVPSS